MHPEAEAVAAEVALERGATIVHAQTDPGLEVGAPGVYQRRNFAVAIAAAQAFLGELDPRAVAAAALDTRVPGRLQQFEQDPSTILDGAHNPDGIAALIESWPELSRGIAGRKIALLSILDDKDAAAMLEQLAPLFDTIVLTASQNPRALPPPTLESLLHQLGGPPTETVRGPRAALDRARELAGSNGLVVATGSIYLIADLLADAQPASAGRRASML
jgi:dihydrofolate synthase/folylpolyglutamate synthase